MNNATARDKNVVKRPATAMDGAELALPGVGEGGAAAVRRW